MKAGRQFPVPPDQAGRERVLRELDSNLLVEAAAGTGKTTSMVGRMVELVAEGRCEVGTMAAITFTRKAAAELRGRFQVAMETAHRGAAGARRQRLAAALAGSEGLYIGTIHSFCARLLRERPVEAGVDVAFREVNDAEDDLLRRQAWADFCARTAADDPRGLLAGLDRVGLELRALGGAFLRFADYPDVEEWPVAPATERPPDFSAARRELAGYLEHMRGLGAKLPEEPGNDTLIPRYRALPRIAGHHELADAAQLAEFLERFGPAKIVQKIWIGTGHFGKDDAKAELSRWDAFLAGTVAPALAAWRAHRYGPVVAVLKAAAARYDALRAERGVLNYQDLLMKAAALLRSAPHVRRYFRRRLTHLLVDEFQDTDPVQAEVMLLLTADDEAETDWRRCRPRPGSLFVVGDPKQSIYRFRRADIATYNEVRRIVERGAPAVTLSASFRTSPELVAWINSVFGSAEGFPAEVTDESPAYVALQPARADSGADGRGGGLNVLTVPEEASDSQTAAAEHEAGVIARFIRGAMDGGRPPDDFLVVTRNTARLSVYARALQACGVPHQVTGGAALNELREVALLHGALAAALRPDDPVKLVACLRGELFGVGDRELYAFRKAGGRFDFTSAVPEQTPGEAREKIGAAFGKLGRIREWIGELPPAVAVERAVAELGLAASAALSAGADVQSGALAKAVELLRDHAAESWSAAAVVELLGELVAGSETQKHDALSARPEERPVVRVMNLHQAKGLEAPAVFLADPGGEGKHEPELHIDRSGDRTRGYMAVRGESAGEYGPAPLLAHPAGWEQLAAREKRFADAENLRLKYVAATRAGSMLTVVRRTKRSAENPWNFFAPHLEDAAELEAPEAAAGRATPGAELRADEVRRELDAAGSGLAGLARHGYEVHRAKEFAMAGHRPPHAAAGWFPPEEEEELGRDEAPSSPSAGAERGAKWGVVIHQLLEAAAGNPEADLAGLARERLAEQDLSAELAGKAEAEARGVMGSELWKRAMASPRRLAEAPFEVLDESAGGPVPVVLRGAIDLLFEEPDGWVLVDYKTDEIAGKHLAERARSYAPQLEVYARAWQASTNLPIKERLVLFTKARRAVAVGLEPRAGGPGQGVLFE